MTFEDLLDQAIDMLRRRGRVTYRALKLQFQLDDDTLDVLGDFSKRISLFRRLGLG